MIIFNIFLIIEIPFLKEKKWFFFNVIIFDNVLNVNLGLFESIYMSDMLGDKGPHCRNLEVSDCHFISIGPPKCKVFQWLWKCH